MKSYHHIRKLSFFQLFRFWHKVDNSYRIITKTDSVIVLFYLLGLAAESLVPTLDTQERTHGCGWHPHLAEAIQATLPEAMMNGTHDFSSSLGEENFCLSSSPEFAKNRRCLHSLSLSLSKRRKHLLCPPCNGI